MSTGHAVLDEHIICVLKAYRFKAGTRQPIEWLVGFVQPATEKNRRSQTAATGCSNVRSAG
jgi:hypothetical protein